MRKRAKSRSRTPQKTISLGPQNVIILLLVVLIVLVAANLYLNHIAPQNPSSSNPIGANRAQPSTAAPDQNKQSSSPPVQKDDLTSVSATATAPPLMKPVLIPSLTPDMPAPRDIHLQLLNGCGIPGLASRVRAALRQRGFDVLTFGNAQAQDYTKTAIIVRTPSPKSELAARRLANSLGITSDQISVQVDPQLVDTDVTIILGADYKKLNLTAE